MAKEEKSCAAKDKPTINIQLDNAWRSDMDAATVVGGQQQPHKEEGTTAAYTLETKVIAQASQDAAGDLARQTQGHDHRSHRTGGGSNIVISGSAGRSWFEQTFHAPEEAQHIFLLEQQPVFPLVDDPPWAQALASPTKYVSPSGSVRGWLRPDDDGQHVAGDGSRPARARQQDSQLQDSLPAVGRRPQMGPGGGHGEVRRREVLVADNHPLLINRDDMTDKNIMSVLHSAIHPRFRFFLPSQESELRGPGAAHREEGTEAQKLAVQQPAARSEQVPASTSCAESLPDAVLERRRSPADPISASGTVLCVGWPLLLSGCDSQSAQNSSEMGPGASQHAVCAGALGEFEGVVPRGSPSSATLGRFGDNCRSSTADPASRPSEFLPEPLEPARPEGSSDLGR